MPDSDADLVALLECASSLPDLERRHRMSAAEVLAYVRGMLAVRDGRLEPDELIRRTRAEPGGVVLADEGDGLEPAPDVLRLLRAGAPLTWLALEIELPGLVHNGDWWYAQVPVWAGNIAERLDIEDAAPLREALFAEMRRALLELATPVLELETGTGERAIRGSRPSDAPMGKG